MQKCIPSLIHKTKAGIKKMEEPEYYRAINRLFKKLKRKKEIERSIADLGEYRELMKELREIKTVDEFLEKSKARK